jgi:pyruvate dehydrogenase E2 component (dihydrolipoamide acetyltransferase)
LITEVKLPQLGETMEDGTIVSYMVNLGQMVKKGAPLFEVETDKAVLEVESPVEGFVKRIVVDPGAIVSVGELVLVLADKDEDIPDDSGLSTETHNSVDIPENLNTYEENELTASAAEIAESVVLESAVELKPGQTVPLNSFQKITARKMLQSKAEIPCFYLSANADVTDIKDLRDQLNEGGQAEVSCQDFVIFALAIGLAKFPLMTGRLDGDSIVLAETIDIGLAIEVSCGVVAPVLRNLGGKNLVQISADTNALTEKAKNNNLNPDELHGGCITLSNLGSYGVRSTTAIVIPGQCSILGLGRITDTCMPGNGRSRDAEAPEIQVRKIMNMTLSIDHRIANGTYAGQFLDFVRKYLEDASNFT